MTPWWRRAARTPTFWGTAGRAARMARAAPSCPSPAESGNYRRDSLLGGGRWRKYPIAIPTISSPRTKQPKACSPRTQFSHSSPERGDTRTHTRRQSNITPTGHSSSNDPTIIRTQATEFFIAYLVVRLGLTQLDSAPLSALRPRLRLPGQSRAIITSPKTGVELPRGEGRPSPLLQ